MIDDVLDGSMCVKVIFMGCDMPIGFLLLNAVARTMYALDYEFQIVPFKWGYKFIFARGALSNPLYADKHRVQIVSNPLFWDKVQPNFGSSNPLFLDKKWRELLGAYQEIK